MTVNALQAHLGFLNTFVIHSYSLSAQFEVLSIHIQETFENYYLKDGKEVPERDSVDQEKYIQYRIKYAVQHHGNLLR